MLRGGVGAAPTGSAAGRGGGWPVNVSLGGWWNGPLFGGDVYLAGMAGVITLGRGFACRYGRADQRLAADTADASRSAAGSPAGTVGPISGSPPTPPTHRARPRVRLPVRSGRSAARPRHRRRIALGRGFACRYGPHGILVNSIAPGQVATPMQHDDLPPEVSDAATQACPVRRIGRPEEVAAVVVFLASTHAGFVNGATLNVSGGGLIY